MLLIDYLFIGIIALLVVCCMAIESDSIRRNLRQLGILMLSLSAGLCYMLITAESSDSYFFSDILGNKNQSSSSRRQSDGGGGGGKGADPVGGRDATGPGDGWGKDGAPADVEIIAGRPPDGQDDPSGGTGGGASPKHPQQGGAAESGGDPAAASKVAVVVQQGAQGSGSGEGANGDVIRDCPDCPEMAHVVAGAFLAGSPASEKGRFLHEGPRRRVVIARPFYIGRFEITVDQFAAFVTATGYRPSRSCVADYNKSAFVDFRRPGFPQTGSHPVVCVSWDDAKAYTRWLATRTKLKYRLPSEAEWELAARGGSGKAFGETDTLDPRSLNFNTLSAGTRMVGSFPANRNGVFDMAGNVWELVEDCWQASLAGMPDDGGPRPLAADVVCPLRTMRGGAWYNTERFVRATSRWANPAAIGGNGVGFRVLREIEAAAAKAAVVPAAALPAKAATSPAQPKAGATSAKEPAQQPAQQPPISAPPPSPRPKARKSRV